MDIRFAFSTTLLGPLLLLLVSGVPAAQAQVSDPDSLRATAVGADVVQLEWSNVTGAKGYKVQRRSMDGPWIERFVDETGTATVFLDRNGLLPEERYQYRVIVVGEEAESDGVKHVSVVTPSLVEAREQSECYLETLRDPDRFDCSHVMVSAIRSIAGRRRPEDEWFSVQFKFSGNRSRNFTLIYADLTLQTDAVDSPVDLVNEATFSYNTWLREAGDPERGTFAGASLKILHDVSYLGLQIGGLERVQSHFFGSYAALYPAMWATSRIPTDQTHWNSYLEFSLRADYGPAFFRAFAARGGFLIPWSKRRSPDIRIVLLVPVGGVYPFL